jgi:lysophospholipase L1-like esterase
VVNVSFNDRDPERLEAALRGIVELGRSRGIETVLVVEPMSADKEDAGVRERQQVVRAVGESLGVPTLDLEAHLADSTIYDSGWLWWDQVHLTSYGQALAGRWLAQCLASRLEEPADVQREPHRARKPRASTCTNGPWTAAAP